MATPVEIANAYIALTVKAPGIKKSVDQALGAASSSGDKAGSSIGSRLVGAAEKVVKAGAATVGAGLAAGLGTALVKGFQRLSAIDTARAKLTGLGHDASTVEKVMGNALASVRGTSFGLGDAATTAAQAVAAGIKPGEELEGVLKSVANSAAAAGSDLGEMGGIYAKVASVGKAQNDVLSQVADRGIPIYQALADQLGVTADEVFKMASAGDIGFAQFESAMTNAAGTVATELGNTLGGSWSNFIASLGRTGANLMSGLYPQLTPAVQSITAAMEPLEAAAGAVGEKIGAVLAPAFEWLGRALTGQADFGILADIAGYLSPLGAAAKIVQPVLPLVGDALSQMGSALGGALAAALPVVLPALTDLVVQLAELATAVIPILLPVLSELVTQFAGLASDALPILVDGLVLAVDAFGGIAKSALPVLEALAPAIGPITVAVLAGVGAFKAYSAIAGVVRGVMGGYTAASYGAASATYASGAAAKVGALAHRLQNAELWKLTASLRANEALSLRSKIAILASAAATKVATGAQRVFNMVLKANPLGLILTAITAVVGGLTWFFTKTELGRKIWAGAMKVIGTAATWLWETVLQPTFTAIGNAFTWLNENVVQPVAAGMSAAWDVIAAGATWLWENAIQPVFGWIAKRIQFAASVIKLAADLVRNYFRFWGAVAKWLWENAIRPIFGWIGDKIAAVASWIGEKVELIKAVLRAWGVVVVALYQKHVKPIFDAIGAIFQWVWSSVISPVVGWIRDRLQLLGLGFRLAYSEYIKPAWDNVTSALRTGWNWIRDKVFDPMKKGVRLISDGFKIGADAIKKAWSAIKSAAAKPINFVLETIWNKGLRSFWNGIVDELGLDDMRLPAAKTISFATGGVMPGYTPGRDVHKFYSPTGGFLELSGGEAIMRPEFTRAVGGPAGVARLNAQARAGQAFADGGTFGWVGDAWRGVTSFAGDVVDKIKNAAKVAGEFLTDPVGAVKSHIIDGIINPMLGGADQNVWLKTAAQLPLTVAKGLGDKIAGFFSSGGDAGDMPAAGAPGQPTGWQALWSTVQKILPGAVMTSNFRPGSVTVNGGQSYHALGRAIDVIPATMETFNRMRAAFPDASELIFSPAGNRQLLNGRPHFWGGAVRAQHWDHVHLAMANGGVVPPMGLYDQGGWLPHGGLAVNRSGRPEAVLDPEESAALKAGLRGGDEIHIHNVRGATVDEVADQILWAKRRANKGGKYARQGAGR